MAVDIHKVDQGYSVARHILVALEEQGADGVSSSDIGELLHASGAQVGAWLRDLRCRGQVEKRPVSPASFIVRWYITDAGRDYLNAPEV